MTDKKRPQDQTNEEWLADWQKREDEIKKEWVPIPGIPFERPRREKE